MVKSRSWLIEEEDEKFSLKGIVYWCCSATYTQMYLVATLMDAKLYRSIWYFFIFRYVSGAFTSNDAATFIQAATQIKRCLEVSQRLNAECFLIWPYREGYHTPFQTDVAREIKLFAKLLKLTAEFKDRLNYRCQLIIMPYNNNYYQNRSFYGGWQYHERRDRDLVHTYMWDVTSCLYLLKNYNLDRYYKVSVTPGHHMYMANV